MSLAAAVTTTQYFRDATSVTLLVSRTVVSAGTEGRLVGYQLSIMFRASPDPLYCIRSPSPFRLQQRLPCTVSVFPLMYYSGTNAVEIDLAQDYQGTPQTEFAPVTQ